jgi:mevalonate pyrophosphate decarboxylase
MRDLGLAAMNDYDEVPDFIDLDITSEHVENVAKKMSGSASLSGFDSLALKNVLLMHGQ